MGTVRDTKRSQRRANLVPSVAIAGYTNAGKSSLLNALTGAGVLVEDALFATLDATTRRTTTPDGHVYTLTDTVGFVRHLPHQLVEAFRSTLDEVADSDLILHVVDGSDPNPEWQVEAVREVLGEIADRRDEALPTELVVVNKTDAVDELALVRLRHLLPGAVFVSAHSGAGIEELRERIAELRAAPGGRDRRARAVRAGRARGPRAPRGRGAGGAAHRARHAAVRQGQARPGRCAGELHRQRHVRLTGAYRGIRQGPRGGNQVRSVTLAACWGCCCCGPSGGRPGARTDPGLHHHRSELGELSGLVADDEHWYVINDGGNAATVYVLGKDCQVQDTITGAGRPVRRRGPRTRRRRHVLAVRHRRQRRGPRHDRVDLADPGR